MQSKIRVAVVSESMNVGGGEMIAAKLASYIDTNQFEIKFFVIAKEQDNQIRDYLIENNVSYECLNLPTSFSFKAYSKFSKKIKEFSPDVIHEHLDHSYSWIWSLFHRVPLVATIHTDPFRRKDVRVKYLIKISELFGKLKIVCCSSKTEQLTLDCYKLRKDTVTHIYNPIDSSKYKKSNQNSDFVHFVHVGRFHEIKNHKILIDAFSVLPKTYPNCDLTLAGDGPLFDNMRAYVADKKLNDKITFLGNVTNVPDLLTRMNVFVLPSKSEACPVVLLEAMASGLPIIASEVGGVPELVTDNGILITPSDVAKLVDAMSSLVSCRNIREKMSEASFKNVMRFDKESISKEYEAVYCSMLKRKI